MTHDFVEKEAQKVDCISKKNSQTGPLNCLFAIHVLCLFYKKTGNCYL